MIMKSSVKSFRMLSAICVCAALLCISCTEESVSVPVTSVILNTAAIELTVGESESLIATVTPSNASNRKVIWTSSNSGIASVNEGVVTAVKIGVAKITVVTDEGGKTADCQVTVVESDTGDDGSGEGGSADDGGNGDNGGEGNEGGSSDSETVDISGNVDLSSGGTANCYIVSEGGRYKFVPSRGNSNISVGAISYVEVLWESFGTAETPAVGDLVKNVLYKDGMIAFDTSETYKEGNAVIAAKDQSGNILWSWHIWLTDLPEEHVYKNGAGTLMDRNLGATSATKYDTESIGLLYQWGRKDPFLAGTEWLKEEDIDENYSGAEPAASTLEWPEYVVTDSTIGTNDYTIANPTTFIVCDHSKYDYDCNCDWYFNNSSSSSMARWSTEKTQYDPCPAGWRVPYENIWENAGLPVVAFSSFEEYAETYYMGFVMDDRYCSHDAWYPASGMIVYWNDFSVDYDMCVLHPGTYGCYWTLGEYGILYCDSYIDTGSWDGFVDGHSVRCQKID